MLAAMALSVNPSIARLVCSRSGACVGEQPTSPVGLCACCPPPGKPVVVEYDLGGLRREVERVGLHDARRRGIFRWAALLPVRGAPEAYAADVGDTPVVPHDPLSEALGVEVFLKSEAGNPSGSFKDRGLAVAIALGAALGARRFCLPTQGNAGVAAALFCARLGLPGARVYMPERLRESVYHRACVHFGADVSFAGANIAEAGARMRADLAQPLERADYVDVSTFFEPGRLEGKKTLGLEIFEHFGADGLPEWILYPTGGGTGLVGIWKALGELSGLGLLDGDSHPLPRLVAVQSEACAPVVRALERGLEDVEPVESAGTLADGLDVPGAIMGHRILGALRESRGTALAVSEADIAAAFREHGRSGVIAGYEGAALLTALRELRARGDVAAGSRVLLLHTSGPLAGLSAS